MRKTFFTSLLTFVTFWMVTMTVQAQSVVTTIKNGAKVYIRYNAGTNKKPEYYYLNAGGVFDNSWGTKVVTAVHGAECTLESTTNGYKLHLGISNNGDNVGGNRWIYYETSMFKCDKGGMPFKFEQVDLDNENLYDISYKLGNASFVKILPGQKVGDMVVNKGTDVKYYAWEVVTKAFLVDEMKKKASSTNPVDATFFISDPAFGRSVDDSIKNNWKAINLTNNSSYNLSNATNDDGQSISFGNTKIQNKFGDANDGYMSVLSIKKGSQYKVQQILHGLPSGRYRLSAQGSAKAENACYMFAADSYSELASVAFPKNTSVGDYKTAYAAFSGTDSATYSRSIEVDVYDGTLIIGVENKSSVETDAFIDNFELYYLGASAMTTYNAAPVDFTPTTVAGSSWQEVTSSSTDILNHPEKYFFSVWTDANTLFGLKNGTDGRQGSDYKTMGAYIGVDPLKDMSYLWEVYKTSEGKYVFVNPTSRENMLQTEGVSLYFRFNDATVLNTADASVTLESANYNNWAINTPQGYLHRWRSEFDDVVVDNNNKAYLKLYAIPRMASVVEPSLNRIYDALATSTTTDVERSFDISLLLSNPDASGTDNVATSFGWSTTNGVKTVANANADGKSCIEFPTGKTSKLYQSLTNLPKGFYTLTVHALNGYSGASLYIGGEKKTISAAGTYTVTAEVVTEGASLEVGVDVTGSPSTALRVDNFTLTYSIPTGMNTTEEYYIRKNFGTDDAPDYHYLTADKGVWYYAAFNKHGDTYRFEKDGALSTLNGFEGLQPFALRTSIVTSTSGTTRGYLSNDKNNYSGTLELHRAESFKKAMLFKPVDITTQPYTYYIYTAHKHNDGDVNKEYKYVSVGSTLNQRPSFTNEPCEFEVVTRDQLIREMKTANPYSPVDATFFIDDPNFSKGNMKKSSWKVSNGTTSYDLDGTERVFVDNSNNKTTIQNYGDNNNFMRIVVYAGPTDTYTVQQTLTGLPKGYYRLSAQGIGRLSASHNDADAISLYLFAKNGAGVETKATFDEYNYFTSGSAASTIESRFSESNYEKYKKTIEVFVGDDGNLTIGAMTGNKVNAAFVFDNFEMYYLGEKTETEINSTGYNTVPLRYNVNALDGHMVVVKSATDDAMVNPQNYFFTIWENGTTCLSLANGTASYQGTDYKTMSFVDNPDLTKDLSCLWELYKTTDGKYVFANVTDRERMIQTEDGTNFFRYTESTPLSVADASVQFESAVLYNWAINTPQGYLHRWGNGITDVTVDNNVGYHKIYAIPRSYYVMDVQKAKYYASKYTPQDISLLVSNPEALGTSEDKTAVLAWNTSVAGNIWTKEGTNEDFGAISGKSFFRYGGNGNSIISQSIGGLLKGKYNLRVVTRNASNGSLFVTIGSTTQRVNLSDTDNDYVELAFEVTNNDATITYGVECKGTSPIQFDNFKLYYYGDENTIYAEPLIAGEEYYIRTLNNKGEYSYLQAGSSWGTSAIFVKDRGIEYRLENISGTYSYNGSNAVTGVYPLYTLKSGIVGGRGQHLATSNADGTGGLFNDSRTMPWCLIPRGDEYPFQYLLYFGKVGKFVKYDQSITSGPNMVLTDDDNVYFEIVPKYKRLIEFEKATKEKPVDATFLIKDPNFSKSDTRISAWKCGSDAEAMSMTGQVKNIDNVVFLNNGPTDNPNMMIYNDDVIDGNVSFNFYQTITDIPDGHYIISAAGVSSKADALKMYVSNGATILEQRTFNDVEDENITLNNNQDAYNLIFNNANVVKTYCDTIEVDIVGGTMVIGFKGDVRNFKAFIDNIEMYFCGESAPEVAVATEPKNYTPKSMTSPWIEITNLTDDPLKNPNEYLFVIWSDNEHCLALANGTNGYQGGNYKTMAYTATSNPLDDVSQLWEFYKDNDNQFVLVNASTREQMMQAEEYSSFFRFSKNTRQKLNRSYISFEKSDKYNNWMIKAINSDRWISRWNDKMADIKMVKKANADYYKIYAIKRRDYYDVKYDILYNAMILAPIDVSLLMMNPEAMGEVDGYKHVGWNVTSSNELAVSDTINRKFSALDGRTYFEYRGNAAPTTKLYQTIKNLRRGYYLFSTSTTCAGTNANLYARIVSKNDTVTEDLSAADPVSHIVYVPMYVEHDGDAIEIGIDLNGYQHKKSTEDEDDSNASYLVKFDHFRLQYMGVSEVLASALSDGVYYIRTNKNYGTEMSPEYMYLEAGGNRWGTDPILSKHGFAMELTKLKDGKYSIKNPLYQSGSGHGSMFDGLHFDHAESQFTFQKVHPDDKESYEYWMYSHKASTNISGSTQSGLKGYMIKENDNSLSLLDVAAAPTGDESAIWEIITKTQRIKELQDATYENPMDATFFITDPSFGRNNTGKTSWQLNGNILPITLGNNNKDNNNKDYGNLNISIGSEEPGGNDKSNKYDYNVKIRGTSSTKTAYNLTQKVNIDNLPAGLYRLSVHGYTNTDGGGILYAANEYGELELCELNKVSGYADAKETDDKIKEHRYAAYWFTGNETMALKDGLSKDAMIVHKPGEFKKEIEFKIISNTIIIGVRGELKSGEFVMIDNFELYYLGEAAQDLSKLSEPVERYIYNVDAGKYLNDENNLSQLKQLGKKYYIEPVTGKTDRFYIYTKDINDKKYYISPFRENDPISYVKPNDTKTYEWIIKKASTSAEHNYIYEISDAKGRLFESTGDAANVAYLGFANDKEPRCTRWSFYEAGQYQKDRVFTTLASATRTDMWRILRAAKVNHRDLTGGYAVAGLEEAMDRLDAVWTSPMASKMILEQKASDMKNLMIASTTTRGSEKMPLDVSFYIQNAGLGDKIGWSNYDAWKITSGQNQSYGSNAVERIVSIEKFLYGENNNVTLSQIIKDVPAGKYKLAVDLRTRGSGSYRLFMNADGAEPVELSADNYSNATINTFITDNYIELDKTQDLTIGIQQTRGSVAFDNFKLYFCGNVSGKLKLNGDSTELTILGDWDRMEDLTNSVNKLISKTKESLGVVYAYKNDFILSDNLNVTAEGWQGEDGSHNNVLFYTDYDGVYDANDGDKSNYMITGTSNVVRKNSDGSYTCDNLVITDRMTMHVPYEFTAASVSYSRSNKISTGTLCLPLDLTKMPSGINKFYMPEKIDWDENPKYGKLKLVEYTGEEGKVLPANTPVLYNGIENGTIIVSESSALVHKTSELRSPKPEEDDLSIYGTYKYKYVIGKTGVAVDGTKNSDGLSADVCYYVKTDNNSLVRGNHWFNIGAFRAFVYRGKGELNNVRPSVLYVDFDDVFDAVNEIAVDDAVVVGYYDVKGVCYDKPQKGLNIILYSDGTRHKIYVK